MGNTPFLGQDSTAYRFTGNALRQIITNFYCQCNTGNRLIPNERSWAVFVGHDWIGG